LLVSSVSIQGVAEERGKVWKVGSVQGVIFSRWGKDWLVEGTQCLHAPLRMDLRLIDDGCHNFCGGKFSVNVLHLTTLLVDR
jgi:hypothetical protein